MSNYAIMRCAKLKTMGGVASSLQHNFRERETLNADADRTPDNEHLSAQSTDEAMGQLRELLPEKRRKDAVIAVEYLFTTSPEWAKAASEAAQARFFVESMKWLENKYGAQNVITATIQRDETTPHLSAFVVPITGDGRLSAKEFIGNKAKMSADQTSFAEAVEEVGLKRGVKGSKARHQTISQYYARVNDSERGEIKQSKTEEVALDVQPRVLSKTLFTRDEETPEAIAERVLAKHILPLARATTALQSELQAEKKKNAWLHSEAAKIPSNIRPEEAQRLLDMASSQKREHQREERASQRVEKTGRGLSR